MSNQTNIQDILAQRGGRYGTMMSNGKTAQALKATLREGGNYDLLADDQKECLEMLAHKMSRIVNGDPNYSDSWIDLCGYAQLIVDRLEKEQPGPASVAGKPGINGDSVVYTHLTNGGV